MERDISSSVQRSPFFMRTRSKPWRFVFGSILRLYATFNWFTTHLAWLGSWVCSASLVQCNPVLSCDAFCCSASDQAQLIQMVVWMLQRRLLIQLHTYVCLLVPPSEDEPGLRDEDPPLAARVGGRSLSTPSALSFGSPSMSTISPLLCPTLRGFNSLIDLSASCV